ncbi:MAG TPA: hypothetical protein VF230_14960 [Acidimicrobiales bacterium]
MRDWRLRVVGLLAAAAIAGAGVGVTRAAFSAPQTSAANRFVAGTVHLTDNGTGDAVVTLEDAQPGGSDDGCLSVTYGGTLPSTVRLHATVAGPLKPYLNVTVTRGTDASPAFGACTTFVADTTDYLGFGPGVVYSGTLEAYPGSFDLGIVDPPTGGAATWTTGTSRSYRMNVSLANDAAAAGLTASATFRWEARNL